jgi:hypothetical protein
LNDCEWYAGEDLESCIKYYFEEALGEPDTPKNREDYLEEPCEEVPEEAMNRMRFVDDDGLVGETTRTFREQLDHLIANGQQFPMMFATTEY